MDKLLDTKFVLQRGRTSRASDRSSSPGPTGLLAISQGLLRGWSPRLFKASSIPAGEPSVFDSESTATTGEKTDESRSQGQDTSDNAMRQAESKEIAVVSRHIQLDGLGLSLDVQSAARPRSWAGRIGEAEQSSDEPPTAPPGRLRYSRSESLLETASASGRLESDTAGARLASGGAPTGAQEDGRESESMSNLHS